VFIIAKAEMSNVNNGLDSSQNKAENLAGQIGTSDNIEG
jgi:hypothetical protein